MGFFKDTGKSFLKYSERLVEKTEEYTKIAKLTLDIKKLESSIENLHREMGDYMEKKIAEGSTEIDLRDEVIKKNYDSIQEYKNQVETKRAEIETIKKAKKEEQKDTDSEQEPVQ